MAALDDFSLTETYVIKVFAYTFRSAPTADLIAQGAAYLEAGGTAAGLLDFLFNLGVPNSPFVAYRSTSTDTAFVTALVDNLTQGSTVGAAQKATWVAELTPLVDDFASRGAFVVSIAQAIESYGGTDPNVLAVKALLADRAETAAAFAESPAGLTYNGQGFAQLLEPLEPTFALSTSAASVDEGASVELTLATTNLAEGSQVAFTLEGTGITSGDVTGGQLSGTFTIDAQGVGHATVGLAADQTSEGVETLRVVLPNGEGQVDIAVNDTSVPAGQPTFALSVGDATPDEGAALVFTLTTTNVAAGTVVPFTLSGTGITAADVVGGSLAGQFTVDASGQATATVQLANDAVTEGAETVRLLLDNGAAQLQATINDTSGTPGPAFALSVDDASPDEGSSVTFTLATANVAAGTVVPFTLSGTGITAADIVGGSLQGQFTVGASGVATATVQLAPDVATEGIETLRLQLANNVAQIDVTINDTSVPPPPLPAPDLVVIADHMPNGQAHVPANALEGEIRIETFLTVDLLDQSGATPARMTLADLLATSATAGAAPDATDFSADRGDIPQVSNQGLFTFDLGGGIDRVDYSDETGRIVAVVSEQAPAQTTYVLVNDDGVDDDFNDATDRIDTLKSVEEIVASSGGGVIDLTASGSDWIVDFNRSFDAAVDLDAVADREQRRIVLSDPDGGQPLDRTFIEVRDAGLHDDVDVDTAAWVGVEGSDHDETLIFTDAESLDARTAHLRGGTNSVKFNELTRSILTDVGIVAWAANTDPAARTNDTGTLTATTTFTTGDGTTLRSPATNVATSHTPDNAVAAGVLVLAGSQDAEDALSFDATAAPLLIRLGHTVANSDVLTVSLLSDADHDALRATGYERIVDPAGDDVFAIEDIARAAAGPTLVDAVGNDHDTVALATEALGSAAVGGVADVIDLAAINAAFAFDFDVLDLRAVAGTGLTARGTAGTDDELILGSLSLVSAAPLFESIVVTGDALGTGALTLNLDAGQLKQGASTITFAGNVLSAGGTAFAAGGGAAEVGGPVNLVVIDTTAGAGATLIGGAANDTLTGGAGDDTLRGRGGNDTLSGGLQAETFAFTIGGQPDNVAAAANRISITMSVDGTVLTLSEAAAADTAYADNNGAVADGASPATIGQALASLIDANLADINAGPGSGTLTDASFDAVTGALLLTFAPGVNANDVVSGVLNANADTGNFTLVTGPNPQGGNGGSDTYVFEASGALNGTDTIVDFTRASDVLDTRAFTGAAIVGAGVALGAAAGGAFAGDPTLAEGIFGKAGGTLSVSDFATAAAAGKFVIPDAGRSVVAVTADPTGAGGDTANTPVGLYYVDNGPAAGLSDLTVSLVAVINGPVEPSLADVFTALA